MGRSPLPLGGEGATSPLPLPLWTFLKNTYDVNDLYWDIYADMPQEGKPAPLKPSCKKKQIKKRIKGSGGEWGRAGGAGDPRM